MFNILVLGDPLTKFLAISLAKILQKPIMGPT